mmetsp:Transcript_39816/g.106265  ORF Transcript_39816/g.106265 Transcript_39816/m.106265 type:complete len:221 (-) Transcript_39816:21-683(-)
MKDEYTLVVVLHAEAVEGRAVHALERAGGCLALARAVGHALVRHNARLLEVCPGVVNVAAVAAHVPRVAAHHVLRGEHVVEGAIGGDREAVREGLGGCEGPARPALGLVADRVGEAGPYGVRVEGLRDGLRRGGEGLDRSGVFAIHQQTEHLRAECFLAHSREHRVRFGSPGRVFILVHLLHHRRVQHEQITLGGLGEVVLADRDGHGHVKEACGDDGDG